jgi:tetratricopeptide (TPR) repeat protein
MMRTKSKIRVMGFLWLAVFIGTLGASNIQQTADEMYEAAILKKDADGDMPGAIAIFTEIVKRFPDKRAVAAKAQLQIGMCYEKLGLVEAVKAYELVLKNYADQPELASEARRRMAALRKPEPEGLNMTRLNVSLEFQTLSPDGTKMAGIRVSGEGQNVAVHDLAAKKTENITKFEWGEKSCSANAPVWPPCANRSPRDWP